MQKHVVTGCSVFCSSQTFLLLLLGNREEVDPLRWWSPPALAHASCRVAPQTRHRTDDDSPGGSEGLRRTAVGGECTGWLLPVSLALGILPYGESPRFFRASLLRFYSPLVLPAANQAEYLSQITVFYTSQNRTLSHSLFKPSSLALGVWLNADAEKLWLNNVNEYNY